jgi:hypothetical protein
VIKNRQKIGCGFFVDSFVKTFRHVFFCKRFFSVFKLPSLRNTQKCDKTKKIEEKLTPKFLSFFFKLTPKKVFDMELKKKHICMFFFNSPYRETSKNVLKKSQGKKIRLVGGWVWDLAHVRGRPSIFFGRLAFGGPSALCPLPSAASWQLMRTLRQRANCRTGQRRCCCILSLSRLVC